MVALLARVPTGCEAPDPGPAQDAAARLPDVHPDLRRPAGPAVLQPPLSAASQQGGRLMPHAVPTACLEPRCPYPAIPGGRGRCQRHRRTEAQRGYGPAHRLERRAALPGARCVACGCTDVRCLQRDHVIPHSLGGSDSDPRNRRWLCRSERHHCHDVYGARSDRPGLPVPYPGGRSTAAARSRPEHPAGPSRASPVRNHGGPERESCSAVPMPPSVSERRKPAP